MTKKRIVNIIIFFILFMVWFVGLIFFSKNGFFVLNEKNENVIKTPAENLLKGKIMSGEFLSRENYLAGLDVSFAGANRVEFEKEDNLLFRIKEKGSAKWIYENHYKSGVIKDFLFFPIGFTPIPSSKGKEYEFQIISLNGNGNNFVTTSNDKSTNVLYYFPKSVIKNPATALNFLIIKSINSLSNIEILLSSFIFAIPIFAYVIYLMLNRKKYFESPLLFFSVVLIFVDIFLIPALNYGVTALTFLLLSAVILKYKRWNFLLSMITVTIIIWMGLKLIGNDVYGAKVNLWVYLMLVLVFIQMYVFEFSKRNKSFTYKNVFEDESQDFRFAIYKYLKLDKLFKDKTIMDLGCGFGPDSVNFSKYAKKVIGVDIEKHDTWKEIENEKIEFVVAKSEKLPFKKEYFDAVFLKDLLHHVKSVDATLKEINRVTKKNGKIIILEGNRYNPVFYFYATKLRGHEHFTQTDFGNLIARNFEDVEIKQLNIYPPFFLKGRVYEYFLKLILKTNKLSLFRKVFSYNIAVITKK